MRAIALVLATLLSSGCASMVNDMSLAAQAKFQQILANKFAQKLAAGIDLVVEQLTVEGGFLDDPLVRILLPPPVGLVIDVARDFNDNPQAALLETLMNRAAENAIPVAGPILKTVLANMNADTLQTLVNSPRSAATDVLIAEGGEEVQQALLPLVTQSLTENGAIKIYSDLMQVYSNIDAAENAVANSNEQAVVESVSPDALGEYVVKQAVGGLFKKVAAKELAVRESLDDMVNIVPL
ncbi:DUF4197 domain-containing protein [Zhongshania marina]|nr:DUF4197 domain-containing protein [Marortus luteolus]